MRVHTDDSKNKYHECIVFYVIALVRYIYEESKGSLLVSYYYMYYNSYFS